jgi:hypothetical protein
MQQEVEPAPSPQVQPTPAPSVRLSLPPAGRKAGEVAAVAAAKAAEQSSATAEKPTVAATPSQTYVPPKPWNPRVFAGAAGRIAQVGAFGSVRQAKRGWWFMVRAYPAMANLPAVVRPARNSKGRIFYRFQVGTTSQAHSEVLCQRMQHIRFSCAVVGLPWKAKVER